MHIILSWATHRAVKANGGKTFRHTLPPLPGGLTCYIQIHLVVGTVGVDSAQRVRPDSVPKPLVSTKEEGRADVACGMELDLHSPIGVEHHVPHIVVVEQGGHRSKDQHRLHKTTKVVRQKI